MNLIDKLNSGDSLFSLYNDRPYINKLNLAFKLMTEGTSTATKRTALDLEGDDPVSKDYYHGKALAGQVSRMSPKRRKDFDEFKKYGKKYFDKDEFSSMMKDKAASAYEKEKKTKNPLIIDKEVKVHRRLDRVYNKISGTDNYDPKNPQG